MENDDHMPINTLMQEQSVNHYRRRKPDYDIHQVIEDEGHTYLMKIGEAWEEWSGKIAGETVHGKIILQSRCVSEMPPEASCQAENTGLLH